MQAIIPVSARKLDVIQINWVWGYFVCGLQVKLCARKFVGTTFKVQSFWQSCNFFQLVDYFYSFFCEIGFSSGNCSSHWGTLTPISSLVFLLNVFLDSCPLYMTFCERFSVCFLFGMICLNQVLLILLSDEVICVRFSNTSFIRTFFPFFGVCKIF